METIKYNKAKSEQFRARFLSAVKESFDRFLTELTDVLEETNNLFTQRNLELRKETRKYFKADTIGQDFMIVREIVDAEKKFQIEEFATIYKAIRENSELSSEYWNEEFITSCKEKIAVIEKVNFSDAFWLALTASNNILLGMQYSVDVFYGYEMVGKILLVEDSQEFPIIISSNSNSKELN